MKSNAFALIPRHPKTVRESLLYDGLLVTSRESSSKMPALLLHPTLSGEI